MGMIIWWEYIMGIIWWSLDCDGTLFSHKSILSGRWWYVRLYPHYINPRYCWSYQINPVVASSSIVQFAMENDSRWITLLWIKILWEVHQVHLKSRWLHRNVRISPSRCKNSWGSPQACLKKSDCLELYKKCEFVLRNWAKNSLFQKRS